MNMEEMEELPREPLSADNFRIDVPEFFNFGYDIIDRRAEEDRNKLAMIWCNQYGEERKLTFLELSRLSNRAANFLLSQGLKQNDAVALMLPRIPEWWIFSIALIKLGIVQCSMPLMLTSYDIKHRMDAGKFKMVISDIDNAPKFEEIFNECPEFEHMVLAQGEKIDWISFEKEAAAMPRSSFYTINTPTPIKTKADDLMMIWFTSGTSKFPKMVAHSHAYPLGHKITALYWQRLNANDLQLCWTDTGWAKIAWGSYFGQWIAGACLLVCDFRHKFNPEEIPPLLEKYGVTSICAAPTIYRMLVLSDLKKYDLSQLQKCFTAGENIHKETMQAWYEGTGQLVYEGYGQTETVCMLCSTPEMPYRPGAMGRPTPGWNIELHDEDGKPVQQGEEGRLALKVENCHIPAGLFKGYMFNPEANAESFINGYYYTGDKARCDAEGMYWFAGRNDDIIKSSGYRISPSEVEHVIMQHPAVHEVAVVGAPDKIRGIVVKAYIVLKPEYSGTETMSKDIQRHAKALTAPYKYPRQIEFITQMPKTYSGKIKRNVLRNHAENGICDWI
ncbi:MAG: AMP-binding protein [Victivallaceae bacterium]|nr:AMP-binding protein [Victivallaceae bacterium]MDD3703628.1 AMP-binding protein [Victivallaceae bacterium]MDD4317386.1 AMP-binding protein [Victivallaceae bacterium]